MAPQTKKQKTGEKTATTVAAGETTKHQSVQVDLEVLCDPKENRLALLPDLFLGESVFSFLRVNDLYRLSHTSREMLRKVDACREDGLCVLWEKRCPTRILYYQIEREDEAEVFTVSQVQPFRLLVRGSFGETLRVRYSLFNDMWDEEANNRDGENCRPLDTLPSPTEVCMKVGNTGPTSMRYLWENVSLFFDEGVKNASSDWPNLAFRYFYTCAKHVAAYPDRVDYPSAEYCMRLLAESRYASFPQDFDWDKDHSDRSTKAEFSYRPARYVHEWRRFAVSDNRMGYVVDELSWYRKGYKWYSDSEGDDDDEGEDDDEDSSGEDN